MPSSHPTHGEPEELDRAAIDHGARLASRRGPADRVTLLAGDAKTRTFENADAVICIGASQVWGPPVQDRQPLDFLSALAALRAMVTRGGRVLFGEGVWSRPPTEAAAAPLSGPP